MADVVLSPKASALVLQDLQNELIKGNQPVVPMSGAVLIVNCQKLLTKARSWDDHHLRACGRGPYLKDAPRPLLGMSPGTSGASSLIEGSEGAAIVTELVSRRLATCRLHYQLPSRRSACEARVAPGGIRAAQGVHSRWCCGKIALNCLYVKSARWSELIVRLR